MKYILILLAVVAGCERKPPSVTKVEWSKRPAMVTELPDPKTLMLDGISLGDPETVFTADELGAAGQHQGGITRGPYVYHVDQGVVISMGIEGEEALAKVAIRSEDEMIQKFGTPVRTNDEGGVTQYDYPKFGLEFTWKNIEKPAGATRPDDRLSRKCTYVGYFSEQAR